ncbi:heterokaryon incompatibility protein-domain-containing protein, partial [Cercophora newfieldiana]
YSPLDIAKDEVRLLKLHPSPDIGHDLVGDLVIMSLHTHEDAKECTTHHPPYEALSYQWGNADGNQPPAITINGISKQITPNLHSALRHIRDTGRERVLWIDALCINQDDLEEKSSQVQRMAGIYQLAERVLVWLGDASADSDLAISTLK